MAETAVYEPHGSERHGSSEGRHGGLGSSVAMNARLGLLKRHQLQKERDAAELPSGLSRLAFGQWPALGVDSVPNIWELEQATRAALGSGQEPAVGIAGKDMRRLAGRNR